MPHFLLKLIKSLFKKPPAGRIGYELPNPAIFSKRYNATTFFKDVDWTNWNAVVDGFERRFAIWYFD